MEGEEEPWHIGSFAEEGFWQCEEDEEAPLPPEEVPLPPGSEEGAWQCVEGEEVPSSGSVRAGWGLVRTLLRIPVLLSGDLYCLPVLLSGDLYCILVLLSGDLYCLNCWMLSGRGLALTSEGVVSLLVGLKYF